MTLPTVQISTSTFSRHDELLALIQSSFAFMRGIIDPPSSAERLTTDALRDKARREILFLADDNGRLTACAFADPRDEYLYLGKIAVAPDRLRQGLGRALLDAAIQEARNRGYRELRLETRVELTGNHRTFEAWGFRRTGESAHPGFDRATSYTYAMSI